MLRRQMDHDPLKNMTRATPERSVQRRQTEHNPLKIMTPDGIAKRRLLPIPTTGSMTPSKIMTRMFSSYSYVRYRRRGNMGPLKTMTGRPGMLRCVSEFGRGIMNPSKIMTGGGG
jgi:hypothetical protein